MSLKHFPLAATLQFSTSMRSSRPKYLGMLNVTLSMFPPFSYSKKFIFQSQRRPRSNTNTEEVKVDTIFEEAQFLMSSSSDSEDEGGSKDRHGTMSKHVRKHVITNEGQKAFRMRFKSFVKPESTKHKQSKLTNAERRGTAPAIMFKGKGKPKKLHIQGMDVFIGSPQSSVDCTLTQRHSMKETAHVCKSMSNDDTMAALMSSQSQSNEVKQLLIHSTSDESVTFKPPACSTDGHTVSVQSTGEEKAAASLISVQTIPVSDDQDDPGIYPSDKSVKGFVGK